MFSIGTQISQKRIIRVKSNGFGYLLRSNAKFRIWTASMGRAKKDYGVE
jgi:hypothetical protein